MNQAKRGQVGVTCHLLNPTLDEVADLARASETAGADWLGLPDAFWWRDTWLLVDAALEATDRIPVGPMVTNPFLRHPFQTAAAVATVQDRYGDRVLLGIAAGGSEVSGAAGVDRRDAAERIEELVTLAAAGRERRATRRGERSVVGGADAAGADHDRGARVEDPPCRRAHGRSRVAVGDP